MAKTYEEIHNEFIKELQANDEKVAKEMLTKSREEMSKEFAEFIANNNCKIKGKNNDKR